jgi:hypothetical protein
VVSLTRLYVGALRLLVADLDVAHEGAFAAAQTNPPAEPAAFVPGHGNDVIRTAEPATARHRFTVLRLPSPRFCERPLGCSRLGDARAAPSTSASEDGTMVAS